MKSTKTAKFIVLENFPLYGINVVCMSEANIDPMYVPYTWNFSWHVYFTVEHETRIFAVEISRMKVLPKIFAFFTPCYKAMYENCMLLI